jgi:FemAB-related protein (PEP-CTERM system-associated)
VYHDPRWGELMQRVYGNRPYYLTARDSGGVRGVVQLVLQKSLLFGKHLCSLPYFDASGILADDPAAADALLAECRSLRSSVGVDHVELRQSERVDELLPTRTDKVTLWLDVPDDEEAMWKQLRSKTRNKVRKVLKNELEVTFGRDDKLGEFYEVYSRKMRDLGSPPHSRAFFEAVVDAFGEQAEFCVVSDEGRVLAASLAMWDGRAYHVPWSGSDERHRRSGANRVLFWSMMARAADGPWEAFDFGRSTKDSGTYEFKMEWNPTVVPLHWQFVLPDGESLPQLRPDSGKYRFLTACWRKLPLPMARWIGPGLISKLS